MSRRRWPSPSCCGLHAAGGDGDCCEGGADLLNLYSQFTANPVLGVAGTPVTEAVIDSAETALFAAKVPPSMPKYLVVDSNTYSAIRQIPRFSEYYSAGEAGLKALVEGNVGKMKDFFIFRSQYVPVTGIAVADHSQPGVHQRRHRFGGAPSSSAVAGYRRGC
jgi:hypothetical protein